ncbi:MAG: hypothetical protein J7527_05865 [Chitinophagaceae bacterium]|nr:hypothetical protein [Chitinophagaceae bacterium]
MKRTPLAAQLLTLLGLTVAVCSFGQTGDLLASNKVTRSTSEPSASYSAPAPEIVSNTVEEGFVKWYPQATNAKWTAIEKGFQASFLNAGQKTTAVFDNNGKFSYSIAQVSAENLPAELTAFIKKEYPGYKLLQSIAICDNAKTVYQTSLQHGNESIRIKSIGEEMEVSSIKNNLSVQ